MVVKCHPKTFRTRDVRCRKCRNEYLQTQIQKGGCFGGDIWAPLFCQNCDSVEFEVLTKPSDILEVI